MMNNELKIDDLRQQIIDTGIEMLRSGLVARTWGNVSARVDDIHFLITPSGLDYNSTTPSDIVLCDRINNTFEGIRKPSGEIGVHSAAYEIFEDAGFVIHTHQTFASAIGVYGFDKLDITEEEISILGGIAEAEYGLPGSFELKDAVKKCYESGAHTVLMKHHGAITVGVSKEDAFKKIYLLEEICRRNCSGLVDNEKAIVTYAKTGKSLIAQLDDMAQMIGRKIPVVKDIEKGLKKYNAVIIKGKGIFVKGIDEDDTKALEILVEKAAVTALHTMAAGVNNRLSLIDCWKMNYTYKTKYSKQKSGK